MNLNEKFFSSKDVAVALEMFSAGWCNLQCKYCYIPKTDFLRTVHKNIIEKIKNGSLLEEISKIFGQDLESLSHWGTEPTLTTSLFKDFYNEAFDRFPKLKKVFLSSNFMTNPKNIIEFVNDIIPRKRKIEISIQMSLDGPKWITDINRGDGTTEIIIKNIKEFLKYVDLSFHTVTANFKPTVSKENNERLKNFDDLKEYYDFFENLIEDLSNIVDLNKFFLSRCVDPTMVVPDYYTVHDGRNLFQIFLNQKKLQETIEYRFISPPQNFYEKRYFEKANYFREFCIKQRMFTCSAGDSCFGHGDLDNILYSCHRSFYLPYKEYRKSCSEWKLDEETMKGMENSRDDVLKKVSVANFEDNLQTAKMLYVNRAFHDFYKHRITSCVAMIRELAEVGQVSKVYKHLDLAAEFARFVQVGYCQMDNVMCSSVFEIPSFSVFRLFGNGVFEEILKNWLLKEKVENGNK